MLVLTGIFWVVAFSIMVYFFVQELGGLKKATKMKVSNNKQKAIDLARRHPALQLASIGCDPLTHAMRYERYGRPTS
jgi:hypothetical protein